MITHGHPHNEAIIEYGAVGSGIQEKQINCSFLGGKPYTEMASLLSSCDMCINPIVKGSAASIINKVGDYALSGLPVINTQESTEYRALIEEYQCGINCECGNAEQVAQAIKKLAADKELRKQMGENSHRLAMEKFDRRNTYFRVPVHPIVPRP